MTNTFPIDAVALRQGPMKDAHQTALRYLLSLDSDRLLAPYLREAGLEPRAPGYGNWESDGLDGHLLGHVLSAAAAHAGAGDDAAKDRLDYMLGELYRAQAAQADGYLGGIPSGRALWSEVAAGEVRASAFDLNGAWVPWYNLHKLFSGLLDAWNLAGSSLAWTIVLRLAEWWMPIGNRLQNDSFEHMLRAEFGGMNEVFAELGQATGRADFLIMADRFADRSVLEPLTRRQDNLTGLHANTQIPKVLGYARLGAVTADPRLIDAARFFWETVTGLRTVVIGGNSTREHFHPIADFGSQIEERQGPETCNTVNMVRLSKVLFELDGDLRYIEYAERALFNHLLSAQHPDGGFVYFTPMRPAHYRVYSTAQKSFWCCVGSGLEAQAHYGDLIFSHTDDTFDVNLFVPSEVNWTERGVKFILDSDLPYDDAVRLRIVVDQPTRLRLRVRRPDWLAGAPEWRVNGEPIQADGLEDGYFVFDRLWADGDILSFRVPMKVGWERLSDDSNWIAFTYGPVVLAADSGDDHLAGLRADDSRMGHVAAGPLRALQETPIVVHDGDPSVLVERSPRDRLTFILRPGGAQKNVLLEWFASLHDSRYTIYWPDGALKDLRRARERLATIDAAALSLDERTLDLVQAGEQQPEVEHDIAFIDSETGVESGIQYRTATGFFRYQMRDTGGEASILRVTYLHSPQAGFCGIVVDGEPLPIVQVSAGSPGSVVELDHVLPQRAGAGDARVVEFRSIDGRATPRVCTVRLLR